MTVAELIKELQQFPQDAEVWHKYNVNYADIYGCDLVESIELDNDGDVVLC